MSDKDSPPENKRAAVFMFNAQELGKTLQEVASDLLKSEDRHIESRWYHSAKDVDLFFWIDEDKNIIKQQVSFLGQIVEWNILEGVRTGVTIDDEIAQSMGSPLVRYDRRPQKSAIDQGSDIISYVPKLPEALRNSLLSNFHRGPAFYQFPIQNPIRRLMKSLGLWLKKK